MQITPVRPFGFDLSSALSIQRPGSTAPTPSFSEAKATLRDLGRQILQLRNSVERLRIGARVTDIGIATTSSSAAKVESNSPLGISTQPSPTVLRSTEEVNSTPTSFSPFSPGVSGTSTAVPLLGGVYSGAQGDNTLTFKFKKDGVVGVDTINVEVRDAQNNKIETVSFKNSDPPDTVKTLSNGLTLSLSAGDVKKNDTFTVDVFATVGSAVNPNLSFNGTGNDNPNFEIGQAVTAGSFFINGIQIDVLDTDSINSVLSKITNSSAGVTATFDAATESVVLTQKTPGAGGQIVLGSDTTGFFDATKLSGATAVQGADTDLDRRIADVPQLSGISDGTFSINGTSFNVDVSTDTLNDLIDAINASGAGVTASFDQASGKFSITSDVEGADLELADETSGFFAAVDILEGTYSGDIQESKPQTVEREFLRGDDIPKLVEEFRDALDDLFKETFDRAGRPEAEAAIEKVTEAIREAFDPILADTSGDELRSGFGIDFDFEDPSDGILQLDAGRLAVALAEEPEAVADFLLAEERSHGHDGLLAALDKTLEESGESLVIQLDPVANRGLIVDLLA